MRNPCETQQTAPSSSQSDGCARAQRIPMCPSVSHMHNTTHRSSGKYRIEEYSTNHAPSTWRLRRHSTCLQQVQNRSAVGETVLLVVAVHRIQSITAAASRCRSQQQHGERFSVDLAVLHGFGLLLRAVLQQYRCAVVAGPGGQAVVRDAISAVCDCRVAGGQWDALCGL